MFIFLVSIASCAFYFSHEEKSFLSWMRSTRQFYTGEEYQLRFGIYLINSRFVKDHNKRNGKYTLSLNKYACHTPSEYKSLLHHQKPITKRQSTKTSQISNTNTFDWRTKNVVNPIEDMGQCGADWAFATIQSIESVSAISSGQLKKFSEQHLIDCVSSCSGCKGGDSNTATQFIIDNGGFVCLRNDYEYTGIQSDCKYDISPHIGPIISKYYEVPEGNEDDMAVKIELWGPAYAIVDASNASFQLYNSGIYNEPNCDPYILNLCVGVVGYGVEDEVKYWIVRNAWGKAWGESGYMRMLRANNQCGIASWASVVVT